MEWIVSLLLFFLWGVFLWLWEIFLWLLAISVTICAIALIVLSLLVIMCIIFFIIWMPIKMSRKIYRKIKAITDKEIDIYYTEKYNIIKITTKKIIKKLSLKYEKDANLHLYDSFYEYFREDELATKLIKDKSEACFYEISSLKDREIDDLRREDVEEILIEECVSIIREMEKTRKKEKAAIKDKFDYHYYKLI